MSQLATNGVIAENEERARTAHRRRGCQPGTHAARIDRSPAPSLCRNLGSRDIGQSCAGRRQPLQRWRLGRARGDSKKDAKKLTSERARGAVTRDRGSRLPPSFARRRLCHGRSHKRVCQHLLRRQWGGLRPDHRHSDQNRDTVAERPRSERVMVEHSQPNTHKVFHVGHLRNTALGVAISQSWPPPGIRSRRQPIPATSACTSSKASGATRASTRARNRQIGAARRAGSVRFMPNRTPGSSTATMSSVSCTRSSRTIRSSSTAIDRLLKLLWREDANNEDIAYLLGRFSIRPARSRRPTSATTRRSSSSGRSRAALRLGAGNRKAVCARSKASMPPDMTPGERFERWEELDRNIAWWSQVPAWREDVTPDIQALGSPGASAASRSGTPPANGAWPTSGAFSMSWTRTSMSGSSKARSRKPGKAIVNELIEAGMAEISDGLTVVKIDDKLGLTEPVYRTLPILRSDGTSLYSTKDLALTKRKFEDFASTARSGWSMFASRSISSRSSRFSSCGDSSKPSTPITFPTRS